jgi:quinol monooxygenase YgiN
MIRVVSKSEIKDGMVEAYKKLAVELIQETRKERGCISYELFQDVQNNNIVAFIETWEDQDALERHIKTPHFEKIVPQMAALKEKQPEINVYRHVL